MDDKDLIIAGLQKENEYLKKLLTDNHISYLPIKEIEVLQISNNEKIELYQSYFKGREDVFSFKYISKDGRKGYSVSCKNRANITGFCQNGNHCSNCKYKEDLPLSKDIITKHFQGKISLGIYPLIKGDYCYLIAADFDDKDFKSSALAFSSICHKHNIDNLIEISSSGQGAHVWIFFNDKIKAAKARRLVTLLLIETMDEYDFLDFSSLDRLFPSQDYLPSINGYGNTIALPLDGKLIYENKTVFVDENFIPHPLSKQLSILASTKKIDIEKVGLLLEEYKENDSIMFLSKNVLKGLKLTRQDFANHLIIRLKNEIIIPKAALNNKSVKFLYRLGSVPNPEFYEADKARRAIYRHKISHIQCLYNEDESFIRLPRGCYDDLLKVLNFLNVDVEIINERCQGDILPVSFNGHLYEAQKDGLDKLLKYENGLFVAPPAYGKTVVAIALISELKFNTLIIVPNLNLLKQWKKRLNQFLDVHYDYNKEENKFGVYCGNKKKLTKKIDIASIDSLVSEECPLFNKYGLVIIDEVHHIGAYTYEKVAKRIESKYLYGFTATPKRSDKNEKIIYKTVGEIRYKYKDDYNDGLNKILNPIFTNFSFNEIDSKLGYSELINILLKDDERNDLIIEKLLAAEKKDKNILVLTDRIEHINVLKDKLKDRIKNLFIINGSLSVGEKREFFNKLEHIDNGFIILSTGKYIGEGFDEKKLDTLFIVSPFRWAGTLDQYVGRLNRKDGNKSEINVYDFIDYKVNIIQNMFEERLRGYKRNKYNVNSESESIFEKVIFDNSNYYTQLIEDIKRGKNISFIIANYKDISLNDLLNLKDGVKIYANNFLFEHKNIKGISKSSLSINAILIDKRIVWYGGLNPFNPQTYNQNIMRIDNKAIAGYIISNID